MPELSANAKNLMDRAAASGGYIFVPTISFVEITYLAEKGRLGVNVLPRINAAIQTPNSILKPFDLSHQLTITLSQIPRLTVPEMPDRIIAATALHLNLPLITKDGKIQALQKYSNRLVKTPAPAINPEIYAVKRSRRKRLLFFLGLI